MGVLERTLIRSKGNPWLGPLGGRLLRVPGAGKALRRFVHRILPRGRRAWYKIPAGTGQGLWLKVEPYVEHRYLSGRPEPGVQEEMVKHLRAGGCFYDAGAHIGFYSLLASRLVGGAGCVVAFEPDPVNAAVLRENVLRNGQAQIGVVQAALWSDCGVVIFRRSGIEPLEESSRRGKVVSRSREESGPGSIDVSAVTLDAIAADYPLPTMIKIDVEGAEVEVLEGAQKLISLARPVLLIEVHDNQAAKLLEQQLRQKGYILNWLAGYENFPFPRHLLAHPVQQAFR